MSTPSSIITAKLELTDTSTEGSSPRVVDSSPRSDVSTLSSPIAYYQLPFLLIHNFTLQEISAQVSVSTPVVTASVKRDSYATVIKRAMSQESQQIESSTGAKSTPRSGRSRISDHSKSPSKAARSHSAFASSLISYNIQGPGCLRIFNNPDGIVIKFDGSIPEAALTPENLLRSILTESQYQRLIQYDKERQTDKITLALINAIRKSDSKSITGNSMPGIVNAQGFYIKLLDYLSEFVGDSYLELSRNQHRERYNSYGNILTLESVEHYRMRMQTIFETKLAHSESHRAEQKCVTALLQEVPTLEDRFREQHCYAKVFNEVASSNEYTVVNRNSATILQQAVAKPIIIDQAVKNQLDEQLSLLRGSCSATQESFEGKEYGVLLASVHIRKARSVHERQAYISSLLCFIHSGIYNGYQKIVFAGDFNLEYSELHELNQKLHIFAYQNNIAVDIDINPTKDGGTYDVMIVCRNISLCSPERQVAFNAYYSSLVNPGFMRSHSLIRPSSSSEPSELSEPTGPSGSSTASRIRESSGYDRACVIPTIKPNITRALTEPSRAFKHGRGFHFMAPEARTQGTVFPTDASFETNYPRLK